MGVLGLWRLIDAAGKPVPLESLEGKVLAVDVSIWIHQVIQGYQDRKGSMLPNAHLIGLFHRICKLMYYKIKPVFVFDGGAPMLKKNTIAFRRKQKSNAMNKARNLKNDLINNLIKHAAVKTALDKDSVPVSEPLPTVPGRSEKNDGMFVLPEIPGPSHQESSEQYSESSSEEDSPRKQTKWAGNIHTVDVNTEEFKNLPADVRYDILTDLKETRKQNSWGKLHEMPEDSDVFSDFQMKRLLRRRKVQESLEVAEKEMGGKSLTLEELNQLMTEQGIATRDNDDVFRIASDATTRVIYFSDKNALTQKPVGIEEIKETDKPLTSQMPENELELIEKVEETKKVEEIEAQPSTSKEPESCIIHDINEYGIDSDCFDWESDVEIDEAPPIPKSKIKNPTMNPAIHYMLEYSNLPQDQILALIQQARKNQKVQNGEAKKRSQKEIASDSDDLEDVEPKLKVPRKDLEIVSDIYARVSPILEDKFKIEKDKPEDKTEGIEDKVEVMSSSGSDSDDFVEILSPKVEPKKIEITVNPNVKLEDDMFADIFTPKVEAEISLSQIETKQKIEIAINPDEKIEDDLFADVFTPLVVPKVSPNQIETNKQKIEIAVDQEKKIEDDLLADVFIPPVVPQVSPNQIETNEQILKDLAALKTSLEKNLEMELKNMNPEDVKELSSLENDVDSEIEEVQAEEPLVLEPEVATESEMNNKENEEEKVDEKMEPEVATESELKSKEKDAVQKVNEQIKLSDDSSPIETDDGRNIQIETEPDVNNIDLSQDERISKATPIVLPLDEKELQTMKDALEDEQKEITSSIGKLERQSAHVTEQMRIEAQELLQLFGIPYVVAPMEAEAQCAFLENIELTHGTITDDSDVWLFGGRCVYKNFFDNNKTVLQFLAEDIFRNYKLSRQQLIQLAILVGSDYTTGVAGIGPVTALEILAAFPSDEEDILRGLVKFSTWLKTSKSLSPGKGSLRNKLKNVKLEPGFPSLAVVEAYLNPTIDDSAEPFTWGKPNLTLIADYTRKKFGWTRTKFEDIINPVMKKYLSTSSQKTLLAYYKMHAVPKSIENSMSKRVQTAVKRLGFEDNPDGGGSSEPTEEVKEKKKRKYTKRAKKNTDGNPSQEGQLETISETPETSTGLQKKKEEERKVIGEKEKKVVTDVDEVIPQREQDKANSLQKKLKAIEIFRKSKKGLGRTTKVKKKKNTILKEAHLSESEDSS